MMTRTVFLCAAALALPGAAQELVSVQRVAANSSGPELKLVFECSGPPVASVYSRSGPDRLVVELTDAQPGPAPRNGGAPRGAVDFKVKALDLSHVQAVLGLPYRVPPSQIKSAVSGNQLSVTVNLAYEFEDRYKLTPGLEWRRLEQAGPSGYLLWNELVFDPADPHLRVDVGLAKDRLDAREKPTAMIARLQALAAVNGGYFASAGGPLGLVVKDGKILAPHVERRPPRTVWGMMKDRSIEFAQVVAKGQSLMSRGAATWNEVQLALGGGPRLIHRGQVALSTDEEELGPKGNDITRVAARTALATTRDGKMLIATATGYHDNHLQGMRLETLAATLLRRGASEAMNLDGGASTTMAIGSQVVSNGPAAPPLEKAVATAVLVADNRPRCYPARIKVKMEGSSLAADGSQASQAVLEITDPQGRPVADGTPVRVYAERLLVLGESWKTRAGQVTVNFRSVRSPGKARLRVECGAAEGEASLNLVAGAPARVLARLTPGPLVYGPAPGPGAPAPTLPEPSPVALDGSPSLEPSPGSSPAPSPTRLPDPQPSPPGYQRPVAQQAAVTVQVNDGWGNALPGSKVSVTDEAGTLVHSGVTGSNGQSSALLRLPLGGTRLTVSAEGVAPASLVVPPANLAPPPG